MFGNVGVINSDRNQHQAAGGTAARSKLLHKPSYTINEILILDCPAWKIGQT
jgi:hypothetical protein